MPQDSMFPDDPRDHRLRVTVEDHAFELEDGYTIRIEVCSLDKDWQTLTAMRLVGRGSDMLPSAIEDIVHAWLYEDRRAIVREVQRDERLARRHAAKFHRVGS